MKWVCAVMALLVTIGTLYETVTRGNLGLIASGIAIAILNVLMFTLWDDIGNRDDT